MSSGPVLVRPRSSSLRCVVCHATMRSATVAACGTCGVVAHRGCARELTGCPTLGCPGPLTAPEAPRARQIRRSLDRAVTTTVLAATAMIWASHAVTFPRRAPAPPALAIAPAPLPLPPLPPPAAFEELRSLDPFERREAALALGGLLRSPSGFDHRMRAVEALLVTGAHDPDPGVRARCDAAFADGNADRVRFHLEAALERSDPELRLVAADVLGRVRRTWARTALLARVDPQREADARVRAVAAARLLAVDARTRDTDHDWAVFDALSSRDADEPDLVVWAILRTGRNARDHANCAFVERALPVLIEAAARPDRVGSACLDLLRGLGRCDAQVPLLAALDGDDSKVRALAATLLGRWLEEPGECLVWDVRSGLERACDDPELDVRIAARRAFAAVDGTAPRRGRAFESACCGVSVAPMPARAPASERPR